MKLIFLDIDGVLNHLQYKRVKSPYHQGHIFCEESINHLKYIIKKTDAFLVITSNWRKSHTAKTLRKKLFNAYGLQHRIIGRTPVLKSKNFESLPRGLEIQKFLDGYKKKVDSFVILDDDNDMEHLLHRLVRTSPYHYGLTREKAEEAIELLTNSNAVPSQDTYNTDFHKQWKEKMNGTFIF